MGKRRKKATEVYEFEFTKGMLVVISWLIGTQKEVGYDDAQKINALRDSLDLDTLKVTEKDADELIEQTLSFFETDWLRRKLKEQFDESKVLVGYTREAVPLYDMLDKMSDYRVGDEEEGDDLPDEEEGEPAE